MRALILLVPVFLPACMVVPTKVWDEVPTSQKRLSLDSEDRLENGDLVRVRTKKDLIHIFRVYKTDDQAFYGVAKNKKSYRVPYAALVSLEVRRTEAQVAMWFPINLNGMHLGPDFSGMRFGPGL